MEVRGLRTVAVHIVTLIVVLFESLGEEISGQTSAFFNYFPTTRWTAYGMVEYFPTHYNDEEQKTEGFYSYFVQAGLGLKYQLIPNKIELEALYTNFVAGSEGSGAGQTFNFGVRIVNQ